jgi:hypothetical protein
MQISQLSEPELEFLADLQSASFTLARGKELAREGMLRQAAYVLQVGGVGRQLQAAAGWRMTSRHVPGAGRLRRSS